LSKPKTHDLEVFDLISHKLYLSPHAVRILLLFDRQNASEMVYNETNTYKDAQQIDIQKMTICRPQIHLKETGIITDIVRLAPLKCWHITTVIL